MRNRRHCGPRPPWWPVNEPWPPAGDESSRNSRAGRLRFFRRIAVLGFLALLLGVCGVVSILWLVLTRLGMAGPSSGALVISLGIAGFLMVALALAALARMMRRIGSPLQGVMEAADQVAAGNYSVRVAERGPPPIRALAKAFNTMTDRLGSHDRLRRDMMADIAHELRTPLAVIQGKLEGLLDGVYDRNDAQLTELLAEVHVLGRLVEDLRTLALSESGALKLEKELTDAGALANDVARAFQSKAQNRNVDLHVEEATDLLPITIDAVRIREVLTNLVTNALAHTPAGGTVVIRLSNADSTRISIEVSDTGTGMSAEETSRAFERFHKGAESRGSGLGLAIARNLVVAHGGDIEIASEAGRGTSVRFGLPRNNVQ